MKFAECTFTHIVKFVVPRSTTEEYLLNQPKKIYFWNFFSRSLTKRHCRLRSSSCCERFTLATCINSRLSRLYGDRPRPFLDPVTCKEKLRTLFCAYSRAHNSSTMCFQRTHCECSRERRATLTAVHICCFSRDLILAGHQNTEKIQRSDGSAH